MADLLDDCVAAAVDALVDRHGLVWDEAAFDALAAAVRAGLADTTRLVVHDVVRVLGAVAGRRQGAERLGGAWRCCRRWRT